MVNAFGIPSCPFVSFVFNAFVVNAFRDPLYSRLFRICNSPSSDSGGNENGDKCAWTFGGPYVVFLDGTHWKIQGNWSNYAYDHNTGYPNSSGQKGLRRRHQLPRPLHQVVFTLAGKTKTPRHSRCGVFFVKAPGLGFILSDYERHLR